jgi:hypothetical protein
MGKKKEKSNYEGSQIVKTCANEAQGLNLIGSVGFTAMGINLSLDDQPNINNTCKSSWCNGNAGITAVGAGQRFYTKYKKKKKTSRQR